MGKPLGDGRRERCKQMAHNDYGAFVWKNDERAQSNEDANLLRLDGGDGGAAIYAELMKQYPSLAGEGSHSAGDVDAGAKSDATTCPVEPIMSSSADKTFHAVLGDGEWRLGCYKTSVPYLYHVTGDGQSQTVGQLDLLSYTVDMPEGYVDPEDRWADDVDAEPGEAVFYVDHSVDGYWSEIPLTRNYSCDWADSLPAGGLEIIVPDGPVITLDRGRSHAKWHWETIHVTMVIDGDRWEAEVGSGYGAGFEGSAANRARNVETVVKYCEQTGAKHWRRMLSCPVCGGRPVASKPGRGALTARKATAVCEQCGLTVTLRINGVRDLNAWDPRGVDLKEMELSSWALANSLQLLQSEWNALASDQKAVDRLLATEPLGGSAWRVESFYLTLDGFGAARVARSMPAGQLTA